MQFDLLFVLQFFFVKMKQYNTNISSVIFTCDTSSYVCEAFFSQGRMWNYSSITPRGRASLGYIDLVQIRSDRKIPALVLSPEF